MAWCVENIGWTQDEADAELARFNMSADGDGRMDLDGYRMHVSPQPPSTGGSNDWIDEMFNGIDFDKNE